jgi:hypothetical protein
MFDVYLQKGSNIMNKLICIFLLCCFFPIVAVCQTDNGNTFQEEKDVKLDTIFKLGGKKIICTVLKVGQSSVSFTKPHQGQVMELGRKEIEKIIYKNGRLDIFNKPVFEMVEKFQWQAVLITENPAEVEGLYKRAVLSSNASTGSRNPKAAKNSATMRLQKKAANVGALIVLLTRSEMKGGYGEVPGWELEGIGYSDTPPDDTAAVNKEIRKMMERNSEKINKAKKK